MVRTSRGHTGTVLLPSFTQPSAVLAADSSDLSQNSHAMNSRCHLVSRSPAWSGLVRDCALTAQHILLGRMLQFLCFRRNRLNFNTSIYTCLKCLTCSVFVSSLSVHGDEILRVNAMLLIFFSCNLTEVLSKSHLKKIKKKDFEIPHFSFK